MSTKGFVIVDCPWGCILAVPLPKPCDLGVTLGTAIREEARFREFDLSSRHVDHMLRETFNTIDRLEDACGSKH